MWQVRVAGLSGAASVAAGAAGAHAMKGKDEDWVGVWRTAVQYHQVHTLALLGCAAVPSRRARAAAGVLFVTGTALFSGTNYVVAYYEDRALSKGAPVGGAVDEKWTWPRHVSHEGGDPLGMFLIGGWLSLLLL